VQAGIDEGVGGDIVKVTEPAPRKFVRIGVRRHAATGVISLEQAPTVSASGHLTGSPFTGEIRAAGLKTPEHRSEERPSISRTTKYCMVRHKDLY
jgi:hypothetical protein